MLWAPAIARPAWAGAAAIEVAVTSWSATAL
jgi:hypothetical protein